MSHRVTFALDTPTVTRLQRLSKQWQVSQAEVVRRAIAQAAEPAPAANPVAMLQRLHADGQGLSATQADEYLKQVREDRLGYSNSPRGFD